LIKLIEYKSNFKQADEEFNLIDSQLKKLVELGHEIQLHIHPHWEDSYLTEQGWVINTERYKLSDFTKAEINDIVRRYKAVLCTYQHEIFAYRAGGWCIQPFDKLKDAFSKNDIWLDSTIYQNGKNKSKEIDFNFTNAPKSDQYKFSENPLIEDRNGIFLEIPITSIKVSPIFYWKLAYSKLVRSKKHKKFGDGNSVEQSDSQKLRLLSQSSYMAASTDGLKATLLDKSIESALTEKRMNFVSVGHPKSTSSLSLEKINLILNKYSNSCSFIGYKIFKL